MMQVSQDGNASSQWPSLGCHPSPRVVRVVRCSSRRAVGSRLPQHENTRQSGTPNSRCTVGWKGPPWVLVGPHTVGPGAFSAAFTVSSDAGAYLCNETYHCTMKAVCERPSAEPVPPPVLFLHLRAVQVFRRRVLRWSRRAWPTCLSPIQSSLRTWWLEHSRRPAGRSWSRNVAPVKPTPICGNFRWQM